MPEIIDVQVHVYERDRPERPWTDVLTGPPEVTGEDMIAAMDAVGVDAAIIVSAWTMYRYDPSYAMSVYADHPDRFRLVKPVDANDPGVGETLDDWGKTDGAVGTRIMMREEVSHDPADPGINRVLQAAGRNGLPCNLACRGRLEQVAEMAARNPGTRIVVDHLGLRQPQHPPAPDKPWEELPLLLNLAQYDNVAVKISGACTLSKQPFPYDDLWDPLRRIFDAFGFERCMWGTDWTRAINVVSYEQGVEPFRRTDRLSDSERTALMGGTLKKIYGW